MQIYTQHDKLGELRKLLEDLKGSIKEVDTWECPEGTNKTHLVAFRIKMVDAKESGERLLRCITPSSRRDPN